MFPLVVILDLSYKSINHKEISWAALIALFIADENQIPQPHSDNIEGSLSLV